MHSTMGKNGRRRSLAVSLQIYGKQVFLQRIQTSCSGTQLENTSRTLKGFGWIYNDPDMSDKTWKKKEYKKKGLNYFCQEELLSCANTEQETTG